MMVCFHMGVFSFGPCWVTMTRADGSEQTCMLWRLVDLPRWEDKPPSQMTKRQVRSSFYPSTPENPP